MFSMYGRAMIERKSDSEGRSWRSDYFSAIHLPRPLCHQDRSEIIEDPIRLDCGYYKATNKDEDC